MFRVSNRPVRRAFLALCLALASPALANAGDAPGTQLLRPYSAVYKTIAHGLELTLTRRLQESGDGKYTLTNDGRILVVGFHEVSVFRVEDGHVVPRTYVYQGNGLINRRREVHFTPGSPTIRSLYKGEWYDLPYSEGTLDRMSQMEQVRLELLRDAAAERDITVRVADGRKIKQYLLQYVGEETLETPMGPIQTVHFRREHEDPERKSDMWMAPSLDYLMVKTVHVEDGSPAEMILTSASFAGEPGADTLAGKGAAD